MTVMSQDIALTRRFQLVSRRRAIVLPPMSDLFWSALALNVNVYEGNCRFSTGRSVISESLSVMRTTYRFG